MDTLTQAVLGATIAEAGWRRKLGIGAIYLGVAGGLLPDLDIFTGLMGPWGAMLYHRSLTHSLFFAPIVAPFVGFIAWKWSKKRTPLLPWVHLAFWAIWTHPLLDLFTSYGTQLLFPLSYQRFTLDAVAVIDPAYTLPLILSLWIAYRFRKRPNIGRHLAQIMLFLTTAYLFLGYAHSQQAQKAAVMQLKKIHINPSRVRAVPTLLNISLWRVIAHDQKDNIYVGFYSTFTHNEISFTHYLKPEDPLVERALNSPKGKLFQWFTSDTLSIHIKHSSTSTSVILKDQRFGLVSDPNITFWEVLFFFDEKNHLKYVKKIRRSSRSLHLLVELKTMWKLTFLKKENLRHHRTL